MTTDGEDGESGNESSRLPFIDKYKSLKKYAHYLKTQLKSFSGESVKKGSTIERKLLIYKKLRKLIHYVDENPAEVGDNCGHSKAKTQIDAYYKLLEHKIEKLQRQKQKPETTEKKEGPKLVIETVSGELKQVVDSDGENDSKIPKPVNGNISEAEETDDLVTEVGPTPQLNGRVLTIFDIQTSPEQFLISPLKNSRPGPKLEDRISAGDNSIADDDVFKTPSKPASRHDVRPGQNEITYLASSSRKLTFDDVNTTPVRGESTVSLQSINETPRYLRTQSTSLKNIDEIIIGDEWSDDELDHDLEEDAGDANIVLSDDEADLDVVALPDLDGSVDHVNVEPSPIIKKMGRSLFDLHRDLIGLRRNLTDLGELVEDDEDLARNIKENEVSTTKTVEQEKDVARGEVSDDKDASPVNDDNSEDNTLVEPNPHSLSATTDEHEEEIENVFDPHFKLRKKMKTVKRSTRRAKLRTDKLDLKDELAEIDIHALAFGKRPAGNLDVGLDEGEGSGDDDDFAEREEEYVRKDVKQLEKELNVGKSKGKGRHPLSNNFVRLKINRGRFKRRR